MDFANYRQQSYRVDTEKFLRQAKKDDVVLLSFLFFLSAWFLFRKATGSKSYNHLWYEVPQQSILKANGKEVTRNIATKLEQLVSFAPSLCEKSLANSR